jgi:hypothetical protein
LAEIMFQTLKPKQVSDIPFQGNLSKCILSFPRQEMPIIISDLQMQMLCREVPFFSRHAPVSLTQDAGTIDCGLLMA